MPARSLAEIVRNAYRWPLGSVPYSQTGTASPTGHRPDCSGYASMCLELPPPGENTVTLVTEGHVKPIDWSDMRPGDLVMLGGPGTAGAAGHVGVVVAIDGSTGWYMMRHQAGGVGPTTWEGRIGSAPRKDMTPYRSVYVMESEESDMIYAKKRGDATVWVSNGITRRAISTEQGIIGGFAVVREVPDEKTLTDLCGPPVSMYSPVVDVDKLAKALAPLLPARSTSSELVTAVQALAASLHVVADEIDNLFPGS